jgi:dihydrofolate reductase
MKERHIIAAVADNKAIGYQNKLIYKISNDMQHFKDLTLGNIVIMGRRTYESIGSKPLKCRNNIVVTTKGIAIPDSEINNLFQVGSLEEAYELAEQLDGEKIFVIGGAQLYEAALPHTEWLDLTEVLDTPGNADSFFPADLTTFLPVKRTNIYGGKIPYRFATWRRKDCISYLKQN